MKWLAVVLTMLVMTGCSSSSPAVEVTPGVLDQPSAATTNDPSADSAASECRSRPWKGDILVRESGPTIDPEAAELGSEYQWNWTTMRCEDAVAMALDTAPANACVEVAWARDNPGYDTEQQPPARLKKVVARSDAC